MGAKVTFDSESRLVVVTAAPVSGVVSLDVQVDLYSDMKEDIRASAVLAANPPAFLGSEGGVPTATGFTGQYFFLNNAEGWRIQPYDADHECYLVGNLFPIDPDAAWWVSRPGRTIMMSREFSNLAQAIAVGSGITPGDKTEIIDGVWAKNLAALVGDDIAGAILLKLRKVALNDLILGDGDTDNWELKEDNGVDTCEKWDVTDKNDDPISLPTGAPARRVRK